VRMEIASNEKKKNVARGRKKEREAERRQGNVACQRRQKKGVGGRHKRVLFICLGLLCFVCSAGHNLHCIVTQTYVSCMTATTNTTLFMVRSLQCRWARGFGGNEDPFACCCLPKVRQFKQMNMRDE
jgi:hypothetical protein